MNGSMVIASVIADICGNYNFAFGNVPNGVYNLVAYNGNFKVTSQIEVTGESANGIEIGMKLGNTLNLIELTCSGTHPVIVSGLKELFDDPAIFTPKDEAVIRLGGRVEFKLVMTMEDAPPDDAELITQAAPGQKVGFFGDLSVIKCLYGDEGWLTSETLLSDLGGNHIAVSVELPEHLKKKENLTVYRIHNGVAEELSSTPNSDMESAVIPDGVLSLTLCKFSNFAVTYPCSDPVTELEQPGCDAVPPPLIENKSRWQKWLAFWKQYMPVKRPGLKIGFWKL